MFCLPWDSFLVSNDRPKIERAFEFEARRGLLKTLSCGGKYSMAGTLKSECSPLGVRAPARRQTINQPDSLTRPVAHLPHLQGISGRMRGKATFQSLPPR